MRVKLKLFIHKESSYLNYEPPQDLVARKFLSYCLNLLNSQDNIRREFQLLNSLSLDRGHTTHVAVQMCNRNKNRYINVLPYDSTRVPLLEIMSNGSDYINASFIKGFSHENEYIAAQGPKQETVYDFWYMVLKYRVSKVIMLCSLMEKGKIKCEKYFPDPSDETEFVYNDITVTCTDQFIASYYTSTQLRICRGIEIFEVQHFALHDWQDFSIPGGPDVLINFCNLVRNTSPHSHTTLVHCSAGVGRTGTYIACDILLQYIQHNRKLNVFKTVLDLREQRAHMVQSEAQYVYLYQSIARALENSAEILKTRSGDSTPSTPTKEEDLFQNKNLEVNNNNEDDSVTPTS